jgi:WD40 repeat protein
MVFSLVTASLDGRPVVISGSDDQTVRVWDLVSGAAICEPLRDHDARVSAVATARLQGRPVIISGSHDHTVRVWDLANSASISKALQRISIGTFVSGVACYNDTIVVSGAAGLLAIRMRGLHE